LLREIARARSPWDLIEEICEAPPADLAEAARARVAAAPDEEKRRLTFVLGGARVGGGEEALIDLLRVATGKEVADILGALNRRGARVPGELLAARLQADSASVLEAAIGAAGCSGDGSLAPLVAAHLDSSDMNMHAAIALGRLGARSYTRELLARLPRLRGLTCAGFVAALELMNDPDAVEPLRDYLQQAPASIAWDVHHALSQLTGREPLLPLQPGDDRTAAAAIRAAWAELDSTAPTPPRMERLELRGAEATFTLLGGARTIRIDYDPPSPGSSWPRWNLSLLVGGERVYALGSHCGTCETSLRLIGWPPQRIAEQIGLVRDALRDVLALGAELFDVLHPLLAALRPGHYVAALVDLDLEAVNDPQDSWLWRRSLDDEDATPERLARGAAVAWPGAPHFQLREPVPGSVPAFGLVLPSVPLDRLSASTVAEHERAIADGARPIGLALAWVEDRDVHGDRAERFLIGVLLDGHHKLAAYAKRDTPARLLLLCRLEDCWGPPEDRGLFLREVIGRLLVEERFD
jgi:hypothetical protein